MKKMFLGILMFLLVAVAFADAQNTQNRSLTAVDVAETKNTQNKSVDSAGDNAPVKVSASTNQSNVSLTNVLPGPKQATAVLNQQRAIQRIKEQIRVMNESINRKSVFFLLSAIATNKPKIKPV